MLIDLKIIHRTREYRISVNLPSSGNTEYDVPATIRVMDLFLQLAMRGKHRQGRRKETGVTSLSLVGHPGAREE